MEKQKKKIQRIGRSSKPRIRLMMMREGSGEFPSIQNPRDIFEYLKDEARGLDRECFWRINLDARNRAINQELVSLGTLTASLVHPREVFKGAILSNAAGIIVAHNHPSNEITPSPEDKEVTRRLARAGELLGIPVLDHVIVGEDNFFSFKDGGLI